MANLKSAQKRIRQAAKRTARNKHVRTTARTYVKRTRAALAEGNPERAREAFEQARRQVDKAVSKGVFHWRTGSRTVSRLRKQLSALEARG